MGAKMLDRVCPCCLFRGKWKTHPLCPNCRYWRAIGKPCDHGAEAFEECLRVKPPIRIVRCEVIGDLIVETWSNGTKTTRRHDA